MDEFNFGFEEKPLDQTTIQELDTMVKQCFALRAEYDELKDKASEKHSEYEALQAKIQNILEATGRLNHETPGAGKITLVTKSQVSFPKDEVNAAKLRQYLLDNGMDSMLTMNHQSLNGFFKSKLEELGDGADPTKVLPGIESPEARVTVSMRKGK
jgi:predicted nuclease with TOPRIM domain